MNNFLDFYKDKRVFITGMSGFKGSWLWFILNKLGVEVEGYSLRKWPPALSDILKNAHLPFEDFFGNITSYPNLLKSIERFKPDILIHMAAQPIVLTSYEQPRETYETNVQGTVNVLEAVRNYPGIKLLLNVTTDKVYLNSDLGRDFVEDDKLCGFDPYSNSKSCSELVTFSYFNSFFKDKRDISVATLRAGNVIGGGDFAENRIVPDCARTLTNNDSILIRNPKYTRPFQHVLDALLAYLLVGYRLWGTNKFDSVNVGPDSPLEVGALADIFCKAWGGNAKWHTEPNPSAPKEAKLLQLDTTHLKTDYGWSPLCSTEEAIKMSAVWYKSWAEKDFASCISIMDDQVNDFITRTENFYKEV